MAEVAAVYMLSRVVQMRYRARDGSRHAGADNQGNQFNHSEKDEDGEKGILHHLHELPEGGEQMAVKHGGARSNLHHDRSFGLAFSGFPIQHGQRRQEGNLAVQSAHGSRQRPHGKRGTRM